MVLFASEFLVTKTLLRNVTIVVNSIYKNFRGELLRSFCSMDKAFILQNDPSILTLLEVVCRLRKIF